MSIITERCWQPLLMASVVAIFRKKIIAPIPSGCESVWGKLQNFGVSKGRELLFSSMDFPQL